MKNLKLSCALLTILFVNSIEICSGQCASTSTLFSHDGVCKEEELVLVFEDHFDGDELNLDYWSGKEGSQGDTEHIGGSYYTLDNVTVSDGIMRMTARKEDVTEKAINWIDPDIILDDGNPNLRLHRYTTSWILSDYLFEYGKFEARIKIDNKGKGFWPAFWTFGEEHWNELDAVEFFPEREGLNFSQSKTNTTASLNSHVDEDDDDDGNSDNCGSAFEGPDFSADFHTFAVEWNNYRVNWYVDGELKRTKHKYHKTVGLDPIDCTYNTVENGIQPVQIDLAYPVREEQRIYLNLAIVVWEDENLSPLKEQLNVSSNGSQFPYFFDVDYVRYYKWAECEGDVVLEGGDIDLTRHIKNHPIYNVVVGTNIDVASDVTLEEGQQLLLIAQDEINLAPGFSAPPGSNFEMKPNQSVCSSYSEYVPSDDQLDSGNDNQKEFAGNSDSSDQILSTFSKSKQPNTKIKIYPNPTKEVLNLEFDLDHVESYKAVLVNVLGKTVFVSDNLNNTLKIDVSSFSKGTYFLEIVDKETNIPYFKEVIIKN